MGKRDVCAYKEWYRGVSLNFEQNSVSKGVVQHTVVLGIAIGKIKETKKVQTNISVYFILEKLDYSKDDFCISWYRQVLYNFAFSFVLKILNTLRTSYGNLIHTLINKNTPKHKKSLNLPPPPL
jgi:hypothetical protein